MPHMKQLLPIILIILALTGGIVYTISKRAAQVKQPTNSIGIAANQLEKEDKLSPSVTPAKKVSFGSLNTAVTPSVTPAVALPTVTEKSNSTSNKVAQSQTTTITKTTICTPVYGSADSCTEHVVVDTGAEDALFFNFAGLAYIGGLLSFVKAKSLKK